MFEPQQQHRCCCCCWLHRLPSPTPLGLTRQILTLRVLRSFNPTRQYREPAHRIRHNTANIRSPGRFKMAISPRVVTVVSVVGIRTMPPRQKVWLRYVWPSSDRRISWVSSHRLFFRVCFVSLIYRGTIRIDGSGTILGASQGIQVPSHERSRFG